MVCLHSFYTLAMYGKEVDYWLDQSVRTMTISKRQPDLVTEE